MRHVVILSNVVAAIGAAASGKFPFEIHDPLSGDLQLLNSPRGDMPLLSPDVAIALPGDGMLRAVPLGLPEDNIDLVAVPPTVAMDGPLRDLLDFGNAIGAAVLPHSPESDRLALPMDALHVKMQQQVPKPLAIDDTPSQIRIFGTLPKRLTAKTLKVLTHGRSLEVKYFLGDGQKASSNSVVGIDERFKLDFQPTVAPVVKYKAANGAFYLTLPRPPKTAVGNQVNIEFDDTPAISAPEETSKAKALTLKPSRREPIEKAPKAKLLRSAAPAQQSPPKVAAAVKAAEEIRLAAHKAHQAAMAMHPDAKSVKLNKVAKVDLKHNEKLKTSHMRKSSSQRISPREFVHANRISHQAADEAKSVMAKVAKQVREVASKHPTISGSPAVRAAALAKKAKSVVADAHLSDAKKELQDAFAPNIFQGEGLVLLELNH